MNRQRVEFSVRFPDYDRSEDVWVGGRVDALSGVVEPATWEIADEAIEWATKQAWESWLWECSSDFPIRAIATDPDGREWSGTVSLIPVIDRLWRDWSPGWAPMPAFAVELDE